MRFSGAVVGVTVVCGVARAQSCSYNGECPEDSVDGMLRRLKDIQFIAVSLLMLTSPPFGSPNCAARCQRVLKTPVLLLHASHLHVSCGMCKASVLSHSTFTERWSQALGDPEATEGENAGEWGIWRVDPGPRGVRLTDYEKLKARGGG
eukprot:m.62893 g.62893  ORF g.62893 m.62893 type:complete len:149 (-) comp9634_c0_seq1:340-786(-)